MACFIMRYWILLCGRSPKEPNRNPTITITITITNGYDIEGKITKSHTSEKQTGKSNKKKMKMKKKERD